MTEAELEAIEARQLHGLNDIPALIAEVRRLRVMFDITRHHICDAMGEERGKSWSALGGLAAERAHCKYCHGEATNHECNRCRATEPGA